jgi:hypothetical protein
MGGGSVRISLAVLMLALVPTAAGSVTLFDFDDYPDSSGCKPPIDEPTCASFLDQLQTGSLGGENGVDAFTTVDGLRMDLTTEFRAGFDWKDGVISSTGNFYYGSPLIARFSRSIRTVEVDLKPLSVTQIGIDWVSPAVYVEGYDVDDHLVVRVEAPAVADVWTTLFLAAPRGRSLRSVRLATAGLALVPEDGILEPTEIGNAVAADNLRVEVVPEPSAALQLAVAMATLTILRLQRRSKRRPGDLQLGRSFYAHALEGEEKKLSFADFPARDANR